MPSTFPDGEEYLFNFWKDSKNPKGLWRKTTMESYRTDQPNWTTVLDVDELAKKVSMLWATSQVVVSWLVCLFSYLSIYLFYFWTGWDKLCMERGKTVASRTRPRESGRKTCHTSVVESIERWCWCRSYKGVWFAYGRLCHRRPASIQSTGGKDQSEL